eukprot:CAMPEP_0206025076 /NCGR_PEP_ID=MMETSP1464-20131121/39395_1 /ASSEMBLY_ACC=CAM_ASM_001124 /TAXON_ID=119497 /ORGANISM="Exanthemachrysis gayraliae, Strain RCC1523" /LENGTH=52 /DNA_ID=CAMNT_0053399105 /DNA_START=45 /DNA_END=200 /DNA_ORIENTATION=+
MDRVLDSSVVREMLDAEADRANDLRQAVRSADAELAGVLNAAQDAGDDAGAA